MRLDTYRSGAVAGLFVTLPSSNAAATVGLLDRLVALDLSLFQRNFRFPRASEDEPLARFVLTEIVLQGYAVHRTAF